MFSLILFITMQPPQKLSCELWLTVKVLSIEYFTLYNIITTKKIVFTTVV